MVQHERNVLLAVFVLLETCLHMFAVLMNDSCELVESHRVGVLCLPYGSYQNKDAADNLPYHISFPFII